MGVWSYRTRATPGGRAYPHSVPPVAQYCTPRRTAYHGTGAAEEQGSSSPRRRGNEVMGTTVPADPLVKRDTLRRAGKGSVVRRLLVTDRPIARC